MFRADALLESHRIFHAPDTETARAYLTNNHFWVDFPHRDSAPLNLRVNGVYLPGMYIGYAQYGRATIMQATPARTDFWVLLPVQQPFEVVIDGKPIACGMQRAAVLSPTHANRIRAEGDCARLVLSLTHDALSRQLAALLNEPLHVPLEFEPGMELGEGYGLSFARYVRQALADIESSSAMLKNPIGAGLVAQSIVTSLLLSQPHNYSDALQRAGSSIAPRDIKRAIDYIHGHLQTAITLADIVAAAGIAGRTLFKHFRDYAGTTPMGYVRKARFEKVRDHLLQAPPEQNVAAIAASWGFDHLGRFALEYRRRFSERPSDTLRRQRALQRRLM